MKYNLLNSDLKKLEGLTRIQEINMEAADFYNWYLKGNLSFIDKSLINDIMFKQGLNKESAYFEAMRQMQDIDPEDDEFNQLIFKCRIDRIKELDATDYESDPYYRNITFPKEKLGNWEINYNTYYPFEGFIYNDVVSKEEDSYKEFTSFGYFPTYFKYLIASQKGQVWMSITPHEIATMKDSILEAFGDVVVYGLGLGYYPYMISLKDEVKHITIIEKDASIIDLFNQHILPQFEHKEKISVIQDEAFNYAHNKMNKVHYDYAFVDLWRNEFDGLSCYLKMKRDEDLNKGVKFSYWIEPSLIVMMRRSLLTLIQEEMDGSTDADYKKAGNVFDKAINSLHFILKDREINSFEDIKTLLTDESIKELSKQVY